MELYEKMCQPFGVSIMQFRTLVSFATRIRASPGELVVRGGTPNTKLCMLLHGQAVAHEFVRDAPESQAGSKVCLYLGKLDPEVDQVGDLPARGSVIGGSALVDKTIRGHPYPYNIVASTKLDWIEWDLDELETLIDAPHWRALQASIYHMLYTELMITLNRDRAIKIIKNTAVPSAREPATAPRTGQLVTLSMFVAVPFVGFGFADNAIMIVCGDVIESHFGAVLGLSTLASAGLGNWVSDSVGLGLSDAIERLSMKLGISDGKLTPGQKRTRAARWTMSVAKLVGISVGCLLGMVPLLWLTPARKGSSTALPSTDQ